jgi:Fe-S-cluster containining protein
MTEKVCHQGCLECSKQQETCCTLGVPLNIDDIERITALGYKLEDFAYAGEWDEEDNEGAEDWWMNSMVKVDDKFYKIEVEEDDEEHCFFLERGKGCKLGSNRPLQCKTYPFWVEEGEIVYDDPEDKFCPINKKAVPIKEALSHVNETEESILSYYNKIKKDCIDNTEKVKEIVLRLLKKQ